MIVFGDRLPRAADTIIAIGGKCLVIAVEQHLQRDPAYYPTAGVNASTDAIAHTPIADRSVRPVGERLGVADGDAFLPVVRNQCAQRRRRAVGSAFVHGRRRTRPGLILWNITITTRARH
jgi:hypothetical protein